MHRATRSRRLRAEVKLASLVIDVAVIKKRRKAAILADDVFQNHRA